MNIHEYQAKEILSSYGVPVMRGEVATTIDGCKKIASNLMKDSSSFLVVAKAQIHAGGRGKAGGVKLCFSLQELEEVCCQLLGRPLITHQTGKSGQIVKSIYITEACDIKREFYLSFVLDRSKFQISIIVSADGGVDIEEVAKKNPEKIFIISIDPLVGVQNFHIRQIFFFLNLKDENFKELSLLVQNLYKIYMDFDASLIEINPLVITKENKLIALDAKMTFDDNALFRNEKIQALRDKDEIDPIKLEASNYHLNYVKLDGNIGCMVNGAGLAMATMDIIKLYGGEHSNFLDVGGSATQERVEAAFRIILKEPSVKSILVNIFGGIMHCDVIAKGIVLAAKNLVVRIPLIVRLQGTHAEEGKKILEDSDLSIMVVDSLDDAAQCSVRAAGGCV